jgi:parallel beta-helix repeat protein
MRSMGIIGLMFFLISCGVPDNVTVVEPGRDAQKRAQIALIKAKPGDVIEFAEGQFDFTRALSLDVENVTIRGRGMDKTIWNFENQETGSGGEGLLVTKGGFTIENLAVEDTRGDAIKVEDVKGVTFRKVRVEWAGEPDSTNGAYGLYPVKCDDVLIEACIAIGASDAGIYVGQCKNVIVRNNVAQKNVAGIEIENTVGADVYNNVAEDNTGGMLVFTLPNLPRKEGRQCRVFHNVVTANNRPNFARKGTAVSGIPPGSGLVILASDEVEVFENVFEDNDTANLSIISFLASGSKRKIKDEKFDPYCEAIYIHDNVFGGGGTNPAGPIGKIIRQAFGKEGPDIVYDGIVDPKKMVDGKLPPELGIYVQNNGDATFANLDLWSAQQGQQPNISTDLSAYQGSLPQLKPVSIAGVE